MSASCLSDPQTRANNDLLLSLREILQPLLARGPLATVCVLGSRELNHIEVAAWNPQSQPVYAGFCSNEDVVFLLPLVCDAYEAGLLGRKPTDQPLMAHDFVYVVATTDCEDYTAALHFVEADDDIRPAAKSVIASVVELTVAQLAASQR